MNWINSLMLPPSEHHLVVGIYLLLLANFIALAFVGLVLGGAFWSVFFSVLAKDTRSERYRAFSHFIIRVTLFSPAAALFFGIATTLTSAILYSQVLYGSPQISAFGMLVAAVLTPAGLVLLFLYRASFRFREERFFAHLVPGILGALCLLGAALTICSAISISIDPEKWPFIGNVYEYFMFSWNNLARFITFIVGSFALTGAAVLFYYFVYGGHREDDSPGYVSLVRGFGSALTLVCCILLPIVGSWNLITMPDVALSWRLYLTAAVIMVVLAVIAGRLYGSLAYSNATPAGRVVYGVLLFLFLFSVADLVGRANATQDRTKVLLVKAEERFAEVEAKREEAAAKNVEPDLALGEQKWKEVCSSCHAFDRKVVGPALLDVLPKYRGDRQKLEAYIKNPVKVDPAYPPMPPQRLPAKELTSIAAYELSHLEGEE